MATAGQQLNSLRDLMGTQDMDDELEISASGMHERHQPRPVAAPARTEVEALSETPGSTTREPRVEVKTPHPPLQPPMQPARTMPDPALRTPVAAAQPKSAPPGLLFNHAAPPAPPAARLPAPELPGGGLFHAPGPPRLPPAVEERFPVQQQPLRAAMPPAAAAQAAAPMGNLFEQAAPSPLAAVRPNFENPAAWLGPCPTSAPSGGFASPQQHQQQSSMATWASDEMQPAALSACQQQMLPPYQPYQQPTPAAPWVETVKPQQPAFHVTPVQNMLPPQRMAPDPWDEDGRHPQLTAMAQQAQQAAAMPTAAVSAASTGVAFGGHATSQELGRLHCQDPWGERLVTSHPQAQASSPAQVQRPTMAMQQVPNGYAAGQTQANGIAAPQVQPLAQPTAQSTASASPVAYPQADSSWAESAFPVSPVAQPLAAQAACTAEVLPLRCRVLAKFHGELYPGRITSAKEEICTGDVIYTVLWDQDGTMTENLPQTDVMRMDTAGAVAHRRMLSTRAQVDEALSMLQQGGLSPEMRLLRDPA
eukprot:TRINITY_DN26718_c0_g1_i1.p1 TRINITY_DN26718_c0_g1~~TRINITY_DN26718_c0_g1_i1.p1  ORF type:complete len:535 (+),score=95.80 TRINITY_DN26718_c0_g1_i1:185-1789(+)